MMCKQSMGFCESLRFSPSHAGAKRYIVSDVLYIRHIEESMSLPFSLNILITPVVPFLQLLNSFSLLCIEPQVDEANSEAEKEGNTEQNQYRRFPRSIGRSILW